MRRFTLATLSLALLLVLAAWPAQRAAAEDHIGDTGIRIRAPLDAVDCTANTVSVLGLTIDISTAAINAGDGGGDQGGSGQGGGDQGDANTESEDGGGGGGSGGSGGCAALVAGQSANVKLASDAVPLVATEVNQGGDGGGVKIDAPVQAVDATGKTITVLGLVIDVSQATTGNSEDDWQGGTPQPLDLTTVLPGQFAQMVLVSSTPPLSASEVQIFHIDTKIEAPLDAVDCTANTISVLGLTIDISTAAINAGGDGQGGDDNGGDDSTGSSGSGGCAALVAGQSVEVKLASDATPLVATEVNQGEGDGGVKIAAPVQAVDTTAKTITVLGLVVDVSQATMGSLEDDSQGGTPPPLDLTTVMPGQFVEMHVMSSTPPLSATEVQVFSFANQVEVEVDDSNGQAIDDTDQNGNPVNDVEVDVTETVKVPGATTSTKVKKVLHLQRTGNGRFMLGGLATGHAKISVSRTANGVTAVGHSTVSVKHNTRRLIRVRLRHSAK